MDQDVPSQLEGLWRRAGIWRSNGSSDLVTQVWWFQAARFHIDLRIPVNRNDVTGFAGTTVVQGARCEWHPEIAYPFVSPEPDAGWLQFDGPDTLHETGVDDSYKETWQRQGGAPFHSKRWIDAVTGKVNYIIENEEWHAQAAGHPHKAAEITVKQRTASGAWRIVASTIAARENVITATP